MAEEQTLTAQCLCKSHTFTTPLPPSPLQATTCHCTTCRHISGALYRTSAPWPGPITTITSSPLSTYKLSNKTTILFCNKCSSLIAYHIHPPSSPPSLLISTGILNNSPHGIEITNHTHIADTLDGGATPWLFNIHTPTLWNGAPHTSERLSSPPKRIPSTATTETETPFHCHCKGVNLILKKGQYTSPTPWFVEPTTHKLLAGFDACNSCRRSFSVADITNWTFSLLKYISYADGSSFPDNSIALKKAVTEKTDPGLGTLAFYESSDDVQRYFCSRCSACVFYAADDRPEMVDVAIGLLDSPCGARADSLLEWSFGTMIWSDDCKGGWREEFVEAYKRNTEAYRIENGIPKAWVRVAKEKKDAEGV